MDTDKAWEYYGAKNPYYGVLTAPEFSTENLTQAKRDEFLRSGQQYVKHLLLRLKVHYPTLN